MTDTTSSSNSNTNSGGDEEDDERGEDCIDFNEYHYYDNNQQLEKLNAYNTTSTTSPSSHVKFEDAFESFIQANTSKSICKCFEIMCTKPPNLNLDLKSIFDNGMSLAHIYTQANSLSHMPQSSRVSGGSFQYKMQQKQYLNQLKQQPPTRLVYQLLKAKMEAMSGLPLTNNTNNSIRQKPYWKANELWKKYDKRFCLKDFSSHSPHFNRDMHVLIIGCGPVGLRLSIECAFLGLKCTIVEKRDRFSRNNVLHLWPYTIVDLKNLGAKLFYGKFCAGSIDHISIRKLQCILLKVALLVGVQVHFNTSFEELVEPNVSSSSGWRAKLLPENHPLSKCDFDVVIGADGRRNTLPGFKRKEFRGRLAIGITANFTNYHTPAEVEVEERSGVAFIFAQQFFLDLRDETGIDLENIVYYKDDTHYFVMTAKRQSLLDKGVIKQDFPDAGQLLAKENVNFDKLCEYAKEAAYVSTNKKLPVLNFAKNHYGQADVAMFDFTSLFQAENSTRIIERSGKRLLMALVGDSLLEPFWPTGTGIARGFLAAFDTAWSVKQFSNYIKPIEILCERESIYQLLSQTTHDNLSKNFQDYSIDPTTRYINLNHHSKLMQPNQVKHLYDTNASSSSLNTLTIDKRILNENNNNKSQQLMRWCQMVVQPYKLQIENFTTSFANGLAFCAIIHRFRPDLIGEDYAKLVLATPLDNLKKVFDTMKTKLGLSVDSSTPEEFLTNHPNMNKVTVLIILDKLYGIFKSIQLTASSHDDELSFVQSTNTATKRKFSNFSLLNNQPKQTPVPVKKHQDTDLIKRNSLNYVINVDNIKNIFKQQQQQNQQQQQSQKSPVNLTEEKMSSWTRPKSFIHLDENANTNQVVSSSTKILNMNTNTTKCYICNKRVYLMERQSVMDFFLHVNCFRCNYCSRTLRHGFYNYLKDPITQKYVFYCSNHVGMINPKNSSSPATKLNSTTDKIVNGDNLLLANQNLSAVNRRNFFQSNYSNNPISQQQQQQSQIVTSRPKDYFVNEEKNYKITYRDVRNPWLTAQTEFTDSLYNLNKISDENKNKEKNFKSSQYSKKFDYWENDDDDDDNESNNSEDDDYESNGRQRVEIEEEDLCSKLKKYSTETNTNQKLVKKSLPPERAEFELASTTNYFNRNFPSSNKSLNRRGSKENEEEENFDDNDDDEEEEDYDVDDESDNIEEGEDNEEEDENSEEEDEDDDSKNSSENPTDSYSTTTTTTNELVLVKASEETTKTTELSSTDTKPAHFFNKHIEKLIEEIVMEEERQDNSTKCVKQHKQQQQPAPAPFQKRIAINEVFLKTIENDVKDRVEETNKDVQGANQHPQQRVSYYDMYNVISSSSSQSVSSSSTSSIGLTLNQQKIPVQQMPAINTLTNLAPLSAPLTFSTTTASKLKKFNINYTPQTPTTMTAPTTTTLLSTTSNNGITDDEKQKHQEILLKNQLEKEKNQQLIRQIISTKQKPVDASSISASSTSLLSSHQKLCNSCQKQTCYITERVILNGLIFHRDCIRCFTCNANLNDFKQAASMMTKLGNTEKSIFYCHMHFSPIKEKKSSSIDEEEEEEDDTSSTSVSNSSLSSSIKPIDEDDDGDEDECVENEAKWPALNEKYVTKRKLKRNSNTSQIPQVKQQVFTCVNEQTLNTPSAIVIKKGSEDEENNNLFDIDLIRKRALEKAKLKSDAELGLLNKGSSKLETLCEKVNSIILSTNEGKNETKTENTDSEIDDAPLAKSETFEHLNTSNGKTVLQLTTKDTETNKKKSQKSTSSSGIKTKLSKLLSPLSNGESQSSNGILKLFSNNSSSTPSNSNLKKSTNDEASKKENASTFKSYLDIPKQSLNNNNNTSTSKDKNEFNATNITNSPRLSKNSRTVKLNTKRAQNEEKRLEKMRQDKRLRMSQEIQRKMDEIEAKLYELEQDGVELEKTICFMDETNSSMNSPNTSPKTKSNTSNKKEKLEQELYNLIRQKNILNRVENELNIQSRALAIEDMLAESQQKLRETLNIPEAEKNFEVMENEKKIMVKIVELVEEKNLLVDQLESLRVMEKEEDFEVTRILSSKGYQLKDKEEEIIDKYEIYRDII